MSRNKEITDEQRAKRRLYKKKWWANCSEEKKALIREQRREYYWNARHSMGYVKKRQKPTLCWRCQRAVKECPWSANFEPVPGWEAEETLISASYAPIHSYLVKKCPLFEPDPERRVYEEKAKN